MRGKSYTVFVPIKPEGGVDFEDGLFGAYTDEEWDRIKPYEKYQYDYTTSLTLKSLKEVKEYVQKLKDNKEI